jgi:hypothetical protein
LYVSGTGAIEVSLDGAGVFAGTAVGVRGRSWSYSLGYASLTGVTRKARKCSLTLVFTDPARADALRHVADRDMARGTPGKLLADGWEQRAYIVECEPADVFGGWHKAEATVVLLDGVWRKGHTVSFEPQSPKAGDGDSLDLPYDLPHDLAAPSPRTRFDAGEWGETPLRLVFYGPCIDPSVRIDGNLYRVEAVVPEGGYLVVDPLASPRSVTLVNADGSAVDVFAKARRGDGLGGGEYIFQPVSPGGHEVEWDKSFGFDLTWYEEEGEPPWS